MTTQAAPEVLHAPFFRRQRLWGGLVVLLASLVAFLLLAQIGARQAARGERVLAVMDPLIHWIRTGGKGAWEWLLSHTPMVGQVVTGTALAIVLIGVITGGLRALPLVLLSAAVSLATWGQVMVLADRELLGAWLYGGGLACAFALGLWCPIRDLSGFPRLPFPPRATVPAPEASCAGGWQLPWGWECGLVFALTLIGLVARLYALTELPNHFDLEMIESMVASHTTAGFKWWIQDALVANSGGLLHLLPRKVLFDLFGGSVYTLRLSAVLYGVAAIPLMYWLVRRLAGQGAALASTIVLLSAPEQLFWSRTENVHFSAIALVALITVHLALWMMRRFSFGAVLAAALWMPVSRFAYGAGIIFFLYPIAILSHGALFVRRVWRRLWYAAPLLAGGAALWFYSLSLLFSVLGGHWRFIDPVSMQGGALWQKQGSYRDASPAQLAALQARSITANLGVVIVGMTDRAGGFSHWNERADLAPKHITMISVGVAVIAALGLAYCLGQFGDRRCFALLLWVGIGLLPGLMSNEPADRRISAVFPALYAVSGVFLAAVVRIVRSRGGRLAAWLTTLALSVTVLAIAGVNLVAHFLLPTSPTALEGPIRFTQPLFAESDLIVHNLDQAVAMGVLVGSLDRFAYHSATTPCIQAVNSKTWLDVALNPHCEFDTNRAYLVTMPRERIAELKARYHPQRVTFLLQEMPYNRLRIELLRTLYPNGRVREYTEGPNGMLSMFALTVSLGDIAALHTPILHARGQGAEIEALQSGVLAGVTLTLREDDAAGDEIRVEGGVLIQTDGWFRVNLAPACEAARFNIDGRPAPTDIEPMVAGVHSFEIVLPSATACELPLQIVVQPANPREATALRPDFIVAPAVASEGRGAHAPPVVTYEGYGAQRQFVSVRGTIVDFGVDSAAHVSLLVREGDVFSVHRFDPAGQEEAVWPVQLPPGRTLFTIAVDPEGTVFLAGDVLLWVYDRDGHLLEQWKEPYVWPGDIAFRRDGLILTTMRDRGAVALLDRHGMRRGELKEFTGSSGPLEQPVAVTANAEGDMLVVQEDGEAVLFHDAGGEIWTPTFVRSFPIAYNYLPPQLRRGAFDGPQRVLLPDVLGAWAQVYTLRGERLMAADQARDLGVLRSSQAYRIAVVPDGLYVFDGGSRLWHLDR